MNNKISKTELAKLFDISVQAIDGWIRRGCPVNERSKNGKIKNFSLDDVVRWRTYNYQSTTNTEKTREELIDKMLKDFVTKNYLPYTMDIVSLIIIEEAHNVSGLSKKRSIELTQTVCLSLMEITNKYFDLDPNNEVFEFFPRLMAFMKQGKELDQAIKKYWPKGDKGPFKSVQVESL